MGLFVKDTVLNNRSDECLVLTPESFELMSEATQNQYIHSAMDTTSPISEQLRRAVEHVSYVCLANTVDNFQDLNKK